MTLLTHMFETVYYTSCPVIFHSCSTPYTTYSHRRTRETSTSAVFEDSLKIFRVLGYMVRFLSICRPFQRFFISHQFSV